MLRGLSVILNVTRAQLVHDTNDDVVVFGVVLQILQENHLKVKYYFYQLK